MRGIKFRAWDKGTHSWRYWSLDELAHGSASDFWTALTNWCEYTGLKDKNGKDIYEGDIVKEVFEYNETTDGDRELDYPEDTSWDKDGNMIAINQVVFQNGAFGLIQEDNQFESFDAMRGRTDSWDIYDCEVIGNIYENKELLK